MKNTALKVLLVMTVLSALLLCGLLYIAATKGKGDGKGNGSKLEQFQKEYDERATDSKTLSPEVYYDFSRSAFEEGLYDTARHTGVYDRIEALKKTEAYTQDTPLVIWNPYGVNTLSLYVYYKTEIPYKTSYRISSSTGAMTTFSAECYSKEEYSTDHEYLLLGLVPDKENRVTLSMTDEKGNACVRIFYVTGGSLYGTEKESLSVAKGTGSETLSPGLFAHFGNENGERETVALYDNEGMLRGEIPLLSGSCRRFIYSENCMYYNVSDTKIAAIDRFGRAKQVYDTGEYKIGGDYLLDEEAKKLLVLASKNGEESVNDRLISVDLVSGQVQELLDMGLLLKEYKADCEVNEAGVLEWLNLNSIQKTEQGVLLGAREPSAAFKIDDVYGVPMLSYIIADPQLFADTGYEDYLLTKSGTVASFFGANTMNCVKEEGMPEGVYTLYLFDNHIAGTESRPEFDYSGLDKDLGTGMKKGTTSYYCRYVVDETGRTWQETERIPLEYSGYYGGVQQLSDGHLVVTTAGRFKYAELDSAKNPIVTFTATGTECLKRVFKYDFCGFYFR